MMSLLPHTGGLGDLDFLSEGLGGINVGGVAPMGAPMGNPMGGPGGAPPPFGMDTGLSDLFGLQTGPLVTGGGPGGPVVLPKQVSVFVFIDLLIIDQF